ncbi:MAG: sugar ABC transporter ATP-binding protein [Andreesenia angusta]|nr:sugar ABC transporter ATP-binding protein [Andreesenia angusta]
MNIRMKGIYKAFGKNKVLEGVDFDLQRGEIHSLMGENGAGKSTLMNILTGIHKYDKGSIHIDDREMVFKNAKEAEEYGIAFIHQELNIWPNLTILENLFLDKEIKKSFGLLDKKAMMRVAEDKCKEVGIELPLSKIAGDCSMGHQQMTEIVRALMTDAKVIIMDEPTSALTDTETEKLFEVMHKLVDNNVSIIYISHRMEEIFKMSDRITVLRDGISVSTRDIDETDYDTVVKEMVGRELTEHYPKRTVSPKEVVFKVENLNREPYFRNISFELRKGEILGISGLMGAGRSEIMRAIFGADKLDTGKIYIEGEQININKPLDAIKAGIGFITENRRDEGLILDFSINDNIALPVIDKFAKKGIINSREEKKFTNDISDRLGVKMTSTELEAGQLSGGNQQKVVIAKWIGVNPKILLLDEPTRGVDVGAKREIYDLMNELTEKGMSIIMTSSDLPEILGMSDRIMVIHEGDIGGILDIEEADQEKIMRFATGGGIDGKQT